MVLLLIGACRCWVVLLLGFGHVTSGFDIYYVDVNSVVLFRSFCVRIYVGDLV